MIAIEIHNLTVKINNFPIINNLDLSINERENAIILCEMYTTTLLKVFCGIELPDSGEIWIYNLPPRQAFLRNIVCSHDSYSFPVNALQSKDGLILRVIEFSYSPIEINYKQEKRWLK